MLCEQEIEIAVYTNLQYGNVFVVGLQKSLELSK